MAGDVLTTHPDVARMGELSHSVWSWVDAHLPDMTFFGVAFGAERGTVVLMVRPSRHAAIQEFTEPAEGFPSDELKTKLLLLG